MPWDERGYMQRWREKNKEKTREYMRAWREKNRAKILEKFRKWREENLERSREINRRAKRRAPHLQAECESRRRTRAPKWADRAVIKAIYAVAAAWRKVGVDAEVDHIVPLLGDTVSGLHVHENMTILTSEANRLKGNRHGLP